MEKKSDNALFSVGASVEAAIGKSKKLKEGVLKSHWPKIVGRLSNDSQPEYIKDETLFITVQTSIFVHHFATNKNKYIDIINNYFNEPVISNIVAKIGTLSENRDEYLEVEDKEIFPEVEEEVEETHYNLNGSVIRDMDMSNEGIIKKLDYLRKIATEREKYLLSHGYKKCKSCGMIFESTEGEEFCKVCIEEKKDRKFRRGNY